MTRYNLNIERDVTGTWIATSSLDLEDGRTEYIVTGATIEELRTSIQEGVNSGLGIDGVSFNEVFLTKS